MDRGVNAAVQEAVDDRAKRIKCAHCGKWWASKKAGCCDGGMAALVAKFDVAQADLDYVKALDPPWLKDIPWIHFKNGSTITVHDDHGLGPLYSHEWSETWMM